MANIDMAPNAVASNIDGALLIAWIINSCSYLEIEIGKCLSELIKSKPTVGLAIFRAITTTSVRISVLRSVADVTLKGREKDLLMAIISLASNAITKRNNVAHGLWGFSPEIPDALLLTPATVDLALWAEIFSWLKTANKNSKKKIPIGDRSATSVYKRPDFENIGNDLIDVTNFLKRFSTMRRSRPPKRDPIRRSLLNDPKIQNELLRLRTNKRRVGKA